MRRRTKHYRRNSRLKELILSHIENNKKLYVVSGVIFLIGIILGIIFINNLTSLQLEELRTYINEKIVNLGENSNNYLKELCIKNSIIILIMYISGLTIIGLIANYIILLYKGFSIGFTLSAIAISLKFKRAILFILMGIFLQNILLIPAIIAESVSSMIFLKEIFENRTRENILLAIIRHSLLSGLILVIAISGSCTEYFISNVILKTFIKYIV